MFFNLYVDEYVELFIKISDNDILYFWIDYDNIINHTGKIYLDTYGQRVCYYEPHLDKIKNWFKIDECNCDTPENTDLVVNLRLEDYCEYNLTLPMKYLVDQANTVYETNKCKSKYIVTHDVNNPIVKEYQKLGFKLYHKSLKHDFVFMKNSKHLIICQSTYAWWARVLGNGNVYIPEMEIPTHWRKNPTINDIDLKIKGDRYIYF